MAGHEEDVRRERAVFDGCGSHGVQYMKLLTTASGLQLLQQKDGCRIELVEASRIDIQGHRFNVVDATVDHGRRQLDHAALIAGSLGRRAG